MRRVETALAYAHPGLYKKSTAATVVQDVSFASLTGTLGQLGVLAHYSREMFHELTTLATQTHARLRLAKERTEKLRESVRRVVKEPSREEDATNGGCASLTERPPDRIVFNETTAPPSFKEQYAACEALPNFGGVDDLLGGKCLEKYSDSNFFLKQWAAEQMERIKKLQDEKNQKQKKRKDKKKRKKPLEPRMPTLENIKHSLNWKRRYGVAGDTGDVELASARHIAHHQGLGTPPPSQDTTRLHQVLTAEKSSESPRSSESRGRRQGVVTKPTTTKPPPPPPPKLQRDSPLASTTTSTSEPQPSPRTLRPSSLASSRLSSQRSFSDAVPSPTPLSTTKKKAPPPMPTAAPPPMAPPEEEEEEEEEAVKTVDYSKFTAMLRMHVPKAAVEAKMRLEGLDPSVLDEDSDDESPRAASPLVKPPPPPPPTPAVVSTPVVKKKPPPPLPVPKMPPPKNDLLSAIRNKGAAGLKKPEPAAPAPTPKDRGGLFGNEVDKILSLRQKIAVDDNDSDEEDSDDWDSDDED